MRWSFNPTNDGPELAQTEAQRQIATQIGRIADVVEDEWGSAFDMVADGSGKASPEIAEFTGGSIGGNRPRLSFLLADRGESFTVELHPEEADELARALAELGYGGHD